jgi:hypothetical protein
MTEEREIPYQFSLIQGLLAIDPSVLNTLYSDERQSVVDTIAAQGGTLADGRTFFKTALFDLLNIGQHQFCPDDALFKALLPVLATAQYESWKTERSTEVLSAEKTTWPPEVEPFIPTAEALNQTRTKLYAFKNPTLHTDQDWAQAAAADTNGKALWDALESVEYHNDPVTAPPPVVIKPRSKVIDVVLYGILAIVALTWFLRHRSQQAVQAVFDDNFAVPKSIIADLEKRPNSTMVEDSSNTREACMEALLEADKSWQAGQYQDAAAYLYFLAEEEPGMPSVCRSDACFYLGLYFLKNNKPDEALYFISKVENLEAYGDDMVWYQALIYVKFAAKDTTMKAKARRALERVESNTTDEARKAKAQAMLKELE